MIILPKKIQRRKQLKNIQGVHENWLLCYEGITILIIEYVLNDSDHF